MAQILEGLTTRRFVAVDFDSQQLRLAHAEKVGRHARILKLANAAIPEDLDTADADAMGEFLARTLKDMRLSRAEVVMSVPRGQAVLKPLALPPGTAEADMPGMVQYQVQNDLPFPGAEAVIDFTIEQHYDAEGAPEAMVAGPKVLVAAVRLPAVDHYRQIALTANVRLRRLGLRPYANHRCVETCAAVEGAHRLAVIHITADETEIDVMEDGALAFSRAAVVKLPPARGGTGKQAATSVGTVVMEVTRSLQSYQAVEGGGRIDAVLVAGGTGIETQVTRELGPRLGIPCSLFDPSGPLRLREGEHASAFISALGLAVGHASDVELPFDFLNPKRPPVERDTRKIRRIAAGAAAAVVLLAAVGTGWAYLAGKKADVRALRARHETLEKENKRVKKLAQSLQAVEQWQEEGRNWLDHWTYITCLFPPCEKAYITDLKSGPDGSLSLNVRAHTTDVLTQLGNRLKDSGYEFKLERLATGSNDYGYDFARSIKILIPPGMKVPLAEARPAARPKDDISAAEFGRSRATAQAAAPAGGAPGSSQASSGQPATQAPATPETPAANEAQLAELRKTILDRYDRDHDGRITDRELRAAYYYAQKYGRRVFDANGDGKMSPDEYRAQSAFMRSLTGSSGGGRR